jgi:hypothetical protein
VGYWLGCVLFCTDGFRWLLDDMWGNARWATDVSLATGARGERHGGVCRLWLPCSCCLVVVLA